MTRPRPEGFVVRDSGLGKTVMLPTVTGCRFSCDRRAQSSSDTSTALTANRDASASRAPSRIGALAKNRRAPRSRSSTATGEKSSTIASTRSVSAATTSRAGYALAKHVFDTVEEIAFVLFVRARPRLEFLFRQCVGELLDQLALILRQLLRRPHLNRCEQVAAATAVDVGHPLAAEPQRRTGLGPIGNLHRFGLVERRHLNLAAERERGEVDGDLAKQIVAVAAEEL